MSSQKPPHSPLRDVAQNPVATAQYIAMIKRTLKMIETDLATLAFETGLHLHDVHVDGDRWYDARLRARPVEKELRKVLKRTAALARGLERTAYARYAHDERVANTTEIRKAKKLEKLQRRNLQPLQPAPVAPQHDSAAPNSGYAGPTTIHDLRRDSA